MYTVQVFCEGDVWYVHEHGERINNQDSAKTFKYSEAETVGDYFVKHWKATILIERI